MVAWNGSPEVSRALRHAVPLLKFARNVTIVRIAEDRAGRPLVDAATGELIARRGTERADREVLLMAEQLGGQAENMPEQPDPADLELAAWLHARDTRTVEEPLERTVDATRFLGLSVSARESYLDDASYMLSHGQDPRES